jgi:hypothetical protein
LREFSSVLEKKGWKAKVLPVKGNPRALIVRTTNEFAPLMRGEGEGLRVGGQVLKSVLTSGAVGNLKRRASDATGNGEVHER